MNNKNLLKALNSLKVKGLGHFLILTEPQKEYIKHKEDPINKGILESINRRFTIVCTHDSSFREPAGAITSKDKEGNLFLPPVPFPELENLNVDGETPKKVISGSPGYRVDEYLRHIYKENNIVLEKDDATLLVGFG